MDEHNSLFQCGCPTFSLPWSWLFLTSGRPFIFRQWYNDFFSPTCARWWIGEWQKCSASCGSSGQTRRAVLCIQAVSVDEQKALPPSECEHVPKPTSLSSCNTHIACPADWTAGSWSKVRLEQHYEQFISKFRFHRSCIEIWSTRKTITSLVFILNPKHGLLRIIPDHGKSPGCVTFIQDPSPLFVSSHLCSAH